MESSVVIKETCKICLTAVEPSLGHSMFTAECSHTFHFHCIASNLVPGNQNSCPICGAKWKQIPPFQSPSPTCILPLKTRSSTFPTASVTFHEPAVFDDDEFVPPPHQPNSNNIPHHAAAHSLGAIEVKTFPEVSAVARSASHDDFTILINIKALTRSSSVSDQEDSRAPIDLVTVLDVSGSMQGNKLALLKQAMAFVIHQLGPSDRLSVIAFSETSRRLFPLCRMTDTGREEALRAVNGLFSESSTNIIEGLKKGAKVLTERKCKDPVGSIVLLSDGQDNCNNFSTRGGVRWPQIRMLLPSSLVRSDGGTGIPVHAFGFGADHDAGFMHSIAEGSGGTFSFIETESVIQDAFAQCIGGLLSVVVQELKVGVECVHPRLQLKSIKAGSYEVTMMPVFRLGSIDVGYLYAEEERDFLVTIDIPPVDTGSSSYSDEMMSLLKVKLAYRDPITKEPATFEDANVVKIQRPELISSGDLVVSTEVERQRLRLQAAEAMEEARAAAEREDLDGAVSVLQHQKSAVLRCSLYGAGDSMCHALGEDLGEMASGMANNIVYKKSGRAYMLSGMSAHMRQRATARGNFQQADQADYGDSATPASASAFPQTAYQTRAQAAMVNRSHDMQSAQSLRSSKPQTK